MCSVIGQREGNQVNILEELALPDSSTWDACEAFLQRIWQWKAPLPYFPQVRVYGDATGNRRQTAASQTDWQIVRDFFKRHPYQLDFRILFSNPPVKDRVNCVNAMLYNQAGERRLSIDPSCNQLITDFERVHWKTDASGNMLPDIDKSDPLRSHLSDALGYMIARDFGMTGGFGEKAGVLW